MSNNEPHLERNLKGRHVQLIAIGGTIGTGLFLGSGKAIHLAGPSILLAYLITGIICFFLMRALGDLLLSNLDYPSIIDFVNQYLGKDIGFVAGWTYWFSWIALAMSEVTAIGLYMKFWFPALPQWIPGLVILVILLGLNLITVGLFGETEFWFALIKVVAIVGLIVIGAWMILIHFKTPVGHASLQNLWQYGGIFPRGGKGFVMSFQMVAFSFIGIEMVGMTASEAQNPTKVIPEAINQIPLRIILFYLGSLFVIMCIYPWTNATASQSPFVQVFSVLGIRSAADIINLVVITAAASACNSALFTTGRLLLSLTYGSKNRQVAKLGKLSRRHIPANALTFSTIIVAAAVMLNMWFPGGVFTLVSTVSTISFLFIWGLIIIVHLKFRKTPAGRQSTFKLPFAPWSDYLVLAFLLFVFGVLALSRETLIGLIVVIVWLVGVYALRRYGEQKRQQRSE
ncbi:amino acid transport protein [Lactobacillus selangorensis]|uniref:Amino acid transport protein n=1 Tax=Lactobacillus selangorensis TaxID=81857 RepID=A0A0R2FYI1_9LACO|nr:amino acid permease [Lactobacillus selangorensis]KRN27721.1 amino acid transport protein [Lactobacillus selangorensis]KRN30314.1 amino acid transport protein [Lactobacillus selangorensis]